MWKAKNSNNVSIFISWLTEFDKNVLQKERLEKFRIISCNVLASAIKCVDFRNL